MVCKHYGAICFSLEHIYQDAGDHASAAGGLLLTLHKERTCFLLALLATLLKPLARLSKSLQCGTVNVVDAMQHANVVIEQLDAIAESDFVYVNTRRVQMIDAARAHGE